MFNLHAHSESLSASTTTLTNLAAVSDQIAATDGDYIYAKQDINQLFGVYAIGAGMNIARIETPSIRQQFPLDIAPVESAAVPSDVPAIYMRPESPIPLVPNEGIEAFGTNDTGGAARSSVFTFLSDGAIAPVDGDIRTIRFTTTSPAAAGVFEEESITLSETLPAGTYQVVGARLEDDEAIAFRFVPIGAAHRPGGIVSPTDTAVDVPQQRNGGLGVWFEFNNRELPSLEIFSSGTTAGTINGFLDIIKVA